LAYQEPTDAPSAYDLIILCNFLTNATMTEDLRAELTGLARSLTPGGVLLVLGAVGTAYQAIYATVNELATTAGLRPLLDVNRQLEANPDPAIRHLIATQMRTAVSNLSSKASPEVWATVDRRLRQHVPDIIDQDLPVHYASIPDPRLSARHHRSAPPSAAGRLTLQPESIRRVGEGRCPNSQAGRRQQHRAEQRPVAYGACNLRRVGWWCFSPPFVVAWSKSGTTCRP
jgi:hypothetical protein